MIKHQTNPRMYEYNQYSTIILGQFTFIKLEKNLLNDSGISTLGKELNERLKTKSNDNHDMLNNLINKLYKVNKVIENILNVIMGGIVNSMLKEKLDEMEHVKLNLELKIRNYI